ncbi:Ribosomal large subunit pseudouridine synthase B [Sedimentisphaera cyanobacteriorum]|uniref:Pseudouridine synthase n=1 Tax=Sedimentisphaera cyanobacteriorum TaxID=1940790 RepID=A0A1Q2HLY7_9BACT|nr:pseudouridine synthase [Sedimentisphaera cyanobacteriorum]AQQ08265.1 Ribosomal large subunit pseudouridine synthase B [Sedimentisphaera cyanobacteriorum]
MAKVRLQKILADAGIASRRKCEEIILEGDVRVNREVVDQLPAFADPETDRITYMGRKIRSETKVYFLLNKPKGVLCTSSDPLNRKKAIDFVPVKQRVFCVGRLDKQTTGAIIITNDSELANRLTHPRYELPKTYEILVKGQLDGESIEKLKKGIWLSEGKTKRSIIKVLHRGPNETLLEMTIFQGKNRQVRRMLARLDFKVKRLKRTKIGNISLKGVGIGNFKQLTGKQITYLRKATKLEERKEQK